METAEIIERVPLSALIDRLAGDGPRDEAFVRAFSAWVHERVRYLRLPMLERFELEDVVVTFQMKQQVKLIVTGYPAGAPGEVTISVPERELPFVEVAIRAEPCSDPYEICTLDYAPAGRKVRITGGELSGGTGELVVAATIGDRQENRVRLEDGRVITLSGDDLAFES